MEKALEVLDFGLIPDDLLWALIMFLGFCCFIGSGIARISPENLAARIVLGFGIILNVETFLLGGSISLTTAYVCIIGGVGIACVGEVFIPRTKRSERRPPPSGGASV